MQGWSKKAGMEEGIRPIKHDYMTTMKMKNNYYNGCQNEMQKSQDEGGNKAYKISASQVEEGSNSNTISYAKLFMATIKMKNSFCSGYQHEMQKSRDRWGNNS